MILHRIQPNPSEEPVPVMMGTALSYNDPAGLTLRVPVGGSYRLAVANSAERSRLLEMLMDFEPPSNLRLVVLEKEVSSLDLEDARSVRGRIGFVPASGGLLSHLNAWENMVLPLGYHRPERLAGAAAQVYGILDQLELDAPSLLAKLPESMNSHEVKAACFIAAVLEGPDLMVFEAVASETVNLDLDHVLKFAKAYALICPNGTFLVVEGKLET